MNPVTEEEAAGTVTNRLLWEIKTGLFGNQRGQQVRDGYTLDEIVTVVLEVHPVWDAAYAPDVDAAYEAVQAALGFKSRAYAEGGSP